MHSKLTKPVASNEQAVMSKTLSMSYILLQLQKGDKYIWKAE